MKELSLLGASKRAPRPRPHTHEDYRIPRALVAIHNILQQLEATENGSSNPLATTSTEIQKAPKREQPSRRRPLLGPRQRSYSVTDKEPIPAASQGLSLMELPTELHLAIFDFLDLIDSTCLGLTNRHFYSIHRRRHGIIALSTRRKGPNNLEWAWHKAGVPQPSAPVAKNAGALTALSKLRVRGQGYCRKCGITRCELHKHIQSWMGEEAEYCSIKRKFGRAAPADAVSYCYRSKPNDPNRCGRHCVRKSMVILK